MPCVDVPLQPYPSNLHTAEESCTFSSYLMRASFMYDVRQEVLQDHAVIIRCGFPVRKNIWSLAEAVVKRGKRLPEVPRCGMTAWA